jgi:hypothetical protein
MGEARRSSSFAWVLGGPATPRSRGRGPGNQPALKPENGLGLFSTSKQGNSHLDPAGSWCDFWKSSQDLRLKNRHHFSIQWRSGGPSRRCQHSTTLLPMKSPFALNPPARGLGFWTGAGCGLLLASLAHATENVPHAPFAQWADVPKQGELPVRLTFETSESYNIWASGQMYNVDYTTGGQHYGIDINQGYVTLQYGITEKWAADLSIGYGSTGWRYFTYDGHLSGTIQSTSGLLDSSVGVRYQIFNEAKTDSKWIPTLTFRVGAVIPGTFEQDFPYAPGTGSVAIEPEILARKHFGWEGFGAYFDGLFRWNHTTANDQYIVAAGFFQQIKGWELDAGLRQLGSVNGWDIVFDPTTRQIQYWAGTRENNTSFEGGINYTTPKRHITYGFYTRTVFSGNNSDHKFWLGGYVEIPFTVFKPTPES